MRAELERFFFLDDIDRDLVAKHRGEHNRRAVFANRQLPGVAVDRDARSLPWTSTGRWEDRDCWRIERIRRPSFCPCAPGSAPNPPCGFGADPGDGSQEMMVAGITVTPSSKLTVETAEKSPPRRSHANNSTVLKDAAARSRDSTSCFCGVIV